MVLIGKYRIESALLICELSEKGSQAVKEPPSPKHILLQEKEMISARGCGGKR